MTSHTAAGLPKMIRWVSFFTLILASLVFTTQGAARPVPATPKPFNLKDASVLTIAMPQERAFDELVNSLKRQGYSIEIADKDGGQIATSFTKEKKGRARVEIILIRDSDSQTTARIAAITQAKDYGFTAGPYDYKDPQIDGKVTGDVLAAFKNDLKTQ